MRSLWLATAAFIVAGGIACAQTTPSPMAPGGGTMSPMQPPAMSPMQPPAGHDQATRYLQRARAAIQQHRRAQADTMLSNAETIMLTRTVPQTTGPVPDNSPRVTAIENARAAVKQGNWSAAAQYTDEALRHHATADGVPPGAMTPPNAPMPPVAPMAPPNRTVQ
jgi:hypothetical protein